MSRPNTLADFPPDRFDILAYCNSCGHSAQVDRERVPADVSVEALPQRLRCTVCGSKGFGIRIVFTGAGGYRHG